MKAPPPHVDPITADKLREIIAKLKRCHPPPDHELGMLAAVLTGWQSCNLPDDCGQGREFFTRVEDVEGGPARDKVPPWLRLTFDADKRLIGHPRPGMKHKWLVGHPRHGEKNWRKNGWHDLALDIAPRFREMMQKEGRNPGRLFRDRGGPVERFVAAVIPLVFPDQHLSAAVVGQYLHRLNTRSSKKRGLATFDTVQNRPKKVRELNVK
jgi:hypothetical protein